VTAKIDTDLFLVDSSGWLEYLTNGAKADRYEPYFSSANPLLVPTIVIYEVRKILLRKQSQQVADAFASEVLRHSLLLLDEQIALKAAAASLQYQLAMADAIVYTSAQLSGATLIASDDHFLNLSGVLLL
jgi:predicted nucleic acid-binding protein